MPDVSFDPYYVWLGIPPHQQPPDHYRLLGLQPFETNADVISNAAEQRMAHLRSAQIGRYGEQSQQLLGEITAAMRVLLDPSRKPAYDAALRRHLSQATASLPVSSAAATRPSPRPVSTPIASAMKPLPMSRPAKPTGQKAIASAPFKWLPWVFVGAGVLAASVLFMLGTAGAIWYFWPSQSPERQIAQRTPTAVRPATPSTSAATTDQPSLHETEPTVTKPVEDTTPSMQEETPPIVETPSEELASVPAEDETENIEPESIDTAIDEPVPVIDEQTEPEPDIAAESTNAGPARLTPPSPAKQRELLVRLATLYPPESLKSAKQAVAAAEELLQLANVADTPPDDRFVMLRRAAELAVSAGEADVLSRAIAQMAGAFDIDAVDVEAAMLVRMAASIDVARSTNYARSVTSFAEMAAADDRYDVAAKVLTAAVKLPSNVLGETARAELRREADDIHQRHERYEIFAEALRAVAANPADAAAHTLLAQRYCFDQQDWPRGLTHLTRGENVALRSIAVKDLAGASTAAERMALGSVWWEFAQTQPEPEKPHFEQRALFWYQQVDAGDVTGLDRALLERRLTLLSAAIIPADQAEESSDDAGRFDSIFAKAMQAVREKRYGEADRLFAHCVRLRSTDAAAINNYALTALRIGQSQRAVKQWERLLSAGVQSGPTLHNLARLRTMVDREALPLDRNSSGTLDELIASASANAGLSRHRAATGWLYQQADGGATFEDRCCVHCSGQGAVDCPVRGCSRGKVRVMQSKVVGRNTVTGEAILQSSSVGVPCGECRGAGTVDCEKCRDGIDPGLR